MEIELQRFSNKQRAKKNPAQRQDFLVEMAGIEPASGEGMNQAFFTLSVALFSRRVRLQHLPNQSLSS